MQIFTKIGFKPAVARFRKAKWGNETVIRTAYPVPQVRQFRLRLELATRRTRRAFTERHRSLRGDAPGSPYHAEEIQSRYDRLAAYYDFEARFDVFVHLLCVAAQEGATAEREASFKRQRAWFVAQYPVIRPYLKEFLSSPGDRVSGWWPQRSRDVFEALFRPLELSALLKDGDVIPRLERAQDVVAAWYESLPRA